MSGMMSAVLAGGGKKVGDFDLFDNQAPYFTDRNNAVWLRCGLLTGAANADPVYAALPFMQCYAAPTSVTVTGAQIDITLAASNNASMVFAVPTTVTAGLVKKSTDAGASFVDFTIAGMTQAVARVVFNGTRWIAVGNSATAYEVYTSLDGTTWAAATGLPALSAATAERAAIGVAADGTLLLVCVGQTAAAYSTTNGTTWTSVTLASGVSVDSGVSQCCTPLKVGSNWVYCESATILKYSADRVTWATASAVTNANFAFSASDGSVAFLGAWQSTDGVTWTTNPLYVTGAFAISGIHYAGGEFVATAYGNSTSTSATAVLTSIDGATWVLRNVATVAETNTNGAYTRVNANTLITLENSTTTTKRRLDRSTVPFVGTSVAQAIASTMRYMRIK